MLAARGVGQGDVVAIMLRNSPNAVLAMLATVKCGAVAGMLNYHQRGDVLAHSLGLLDPKLLIAETDLVSAVTECGAAGATDNTLTVEDLERFAVSAPAINPASASEVRAKDTAFYIFTSGTTGYPKASVMTHYRWLKALGGFGGLGLRLRGSDTLYSCLPLYHNNALTVAVSSVIISGATLALGKSFSASRFWDEVIANDATAFIYIGEICRYLLNQPAKPTDRAHKVRADRRQRAAAGDLGGIHQAVRHRAGLRVLRRQRRHHRLHQHLQRAPQHRHLADAAGLRGIRPRHRRPGARRRRTGAPGARRRAGPAAQPGQQAFSVRRLHRQRGEEKKLVRDAFREGDCWFNTGDVMSPQGKFHAAFVDRLGDTFRWKGENVATTQVEAAVSSDAAIEECTVYGVEIPDTGGRAGMAAVQLREGG